MCRRNHFLYFTAFHSRNPLGMAAGLNFRFPRPASYIYPYTPVRTYVRIYNAVDRRVDFCVDFTIYIYICTEASVERGLHIPTVFLLFLLSTSATVTRFRLFLLPRPKSSNRVVFIIARSTRPRTIYIHIVLYWINSRLSPVSFLTYIYIDGIRTKVKWRFPISRV